MISIVLYGRNDNHGHNLHKRVALSLNCMAALLGDPDDEIIFTDYNTPDDLPTLPEAIHDTLTPQARARLRVLRVRPRLHARFAEDGGLPVLEAVARNVAIRRSNPRNRWILSSNTDMILVPRDSRTLGEIAAAFADGCYATARFELPESLWETLDRSDPPRTLAAVKAFGEALHLNEVVHAVDTVRYDGPGDFQLMLRQDLFAIAGFHEGMRRGWHLDANIFRRLALLRGGVGDALPAIAGYHCSHTRQATPRHGHERATDSPETFVANVTTPVLTSQPDWGCPDEPIEEIRIANGINATRFAAFREAVGAPLTAYTDAHYRPDTTGTVPVTAAHLLPFLADQFTHAPRDIVLGWLGPQDEIFTRLSALWPGLGFTRPIAAIAPDAALPADADMVVVNFGVPDALPQARAGDLIGQVLALLAEEERRHAEGRPLRRVIGVNAIHNAYEQLMLSYFGAVRAPFATRLRVGFAVAASAAPMDWLATLTVGKWGAREGKAIVARATSPWPGHRTRHVAYGPYACLRPGDYRAQVTVRGLDGRHDGEIGRIELVIDEKVAIAEPIRLAGPAPARIALPFAVPPEAALAPIQLRIVSYATAPFAVEAVDVAAGNR